MSHHDWGIDCETWCGGNPDDDSDESDCCPVCGAYMELVSCWHCHGEGGFHDCGEDCCCCLDKEEITHDCEECGGEGRYRECSALPHSKEQMDSYSRLQDQADQQNHAGDGKA